MHTKSKRLTGLHRRAPTTPLPAMEFSRHLVREQSRSERRLLCHSSSAVILHSFENYSSLHLAREGRGNVLIAVWKEVDLFSHYPVEIVA